MSATITETAIPLCCVMCLTVPEDPAALHNFGPEHLPYWLCVDRNACLKRAVAAQRGATEETSAPGAATETDPDVPPSGETQGNAAPGAEQDEAEAVQEAEALEPLPAEDGEVAS